jgi:hypothetical protein
MHPVEVALPKLRLIALHSIITLLCGCYFPQREPNIIAKYEDKSEDLDQLKLAAEQFARPDLEKKCATGQKLSSKIRVSFAPTFGMECEWNQGHNRGKGELGTKVSAFRLQAVEVPIEKKHKVCAVQMESVNKANRYNDAMIITLEDRIIASHSINSQKNSQLLNAAKLGLKLKKENIIGLTQAYGTFCPDGVKCEIPRSLSSASISIQVNPRYLKRLAADEIEDSLKLELIMTGNRSIVDCQHSGLNFDLRYTYIEEEPSMPIAH